MAVDVGHPLVTLVVLCLSDGGPFFGFGYAVDDDSGEAVWVYGVGVSCVQIREDVVISRTVCLCGGGQQQQGGDDLHSGSFMAILLSVELEKQNLGSTKREGGDWGTGDITVIVRPATHPRKFI